MDMARAGAGGRGGGGRKPGGLTPEEQAEAELRDVMKHPANAICADCSAPKPRFASITLAIFLCNRCYGLHRGVGAHVTRTKCVALDRWSLLEVQRMRRVGNSVAAAYWERNVPAEYARPTPESCNDVVEKWIRDKYEKKLFCSPDSSPPSFS
ncbi:hypothetical protein O6H91_14G042900 [Diphasiastrum complanatum]|uniref:Uncharacterized protein n=1 Tax=Diphasiastrum complanatum TaxID=34168 RepID=A0ACC2BNZ3_DIPCM|nr:hypothetical protein O6H91_14G042900 [Diphasiastrum complanatum]